MPTSTYIALANLTLSGTASDVTFSSIPATYRDLVLVVNAKHSVTSDASFRLNSNDTANAYTSVVMYGIGSGSGTSSTNSENFGYTGYFNTTEFGIDVIQILDYSATDKHKTVLSRYGTAGNIVIARAGRWANTNAVNSITYYAGSIGSLNFESGSTFALYGIIS